MLFTLISLSNYGAFAQVYNTTTCPPIQDTCNFGGANTLVAGGRQIKCLNEQVILTGRYSPTINGTVIDWVDISNCLGNSDTAHFVSQTFVTSPDTALRAILTFSAPGVYMFLLRAHCNTDPIGFIDGEPQYAVLEDTVRIIIKPIPVANAGPDQLTCDLNVPLYGNNVWFAQLNANSPGSNQIGSWHVNGFSYHQDTASLGADLNDTAAIFTAGLYGAVYYLYWTLEDTLTHCTDADTVRIIVPGEPSPISAISDTICSNVWIMNANETYSPTGIIATQYLPYDSALVTSDTTFYTFYQTSGPDTAVFYNAGGGDIYISVETAGTYNFIYWLHGFCVDDTASYSITFLTATPITNAANMQNQFACIATDTFTFVNVMPDTLIGETSNWTLGTGLTAIGSTLNQDTINVIWNGTTPLPITLTYTIYNADTASGCNSHWSASLRPLVIPELFASPDTVLLCGITNCNFSYEIRNSVGGAAIDQVSVHIIDPQIIDFPIGGDSATLSYGWVYGSYTSPPLYNWPWRIVNMTAPGTYTVLISCKDFCGTFYFDTIRFNVSGPPDEANSGVNVSLCLGNPVVLTGNSPIFGSGHWECTGLPPGHQIYIDMLTNSDFVSYNFVDPDSSTTIVNSHLIYGFNSLNNYYFDWVICNSDCPGPIVAPHFDGCYHSSTSAIVLNGSESSAVAGNDTVICDSVGIYIYTASIQGLAGTWTALPTNPSPTIIWDIHADSPLVTGFSAVGTYGFVWTLLQGCGNLSDTLYVTYNPEGCCFAANNPAYQQWSTDTITQNFVMSGKYYIDGIITVSNNAILDITNVDLVFATCAGINFESGTTIRANNSVLRACNIQDSWRGLHFADSTLGVIENCSFKNAIRAIDFDKGSITVRIFNNTFANNYIGINTYETKVMEAITGNTFTIDNSFVDYYKGNCALPDTFDLAFFEEPGYIGNYGIMIGSSIFNGVISQNNFINGSDPMRNHLFYGIAGKNIFATISNNNFTNMFRSIDVGLANGLTIYNNNIEIAINEEASIATLRYATQIRLTQSEFCKINGNKINSSILLSNLRFTIFKFGGLIYLENNTNIEVSDNITTGAINSITLFECNNTFIANNVLKQNYFSGIYAMLCTKTDISCNEIFMDSSLDGYSGYGITINDIDMREQTSQSVIRNNCVFDAIISITAYGSGCQYKLPVIFNNFLYNYSNAGISVRGTGSIGNSSYPGRNTLISNNYNNGSVDVENTSNCAVTIAGNYGINYVSDSVTVVNSYPYNSSASCANQITEIANYQFNQQLEMSELTDCAPHFDVRDSIILISNNTVELSPLFEQQFTQWKADEVLQKTTGLMNVLAASKELQSMDKVYHVVSNSGKLNANDIAWLNYYYNFAKADYQNALNMLQNINASGDFETHAKVYENILSNMLFNKTQPHFLNANAIVQLKQLAANNDATSHKAADLLRMAIGGYDYDFAKVENSAKPRSKRIKSLNENAVAVWPNPAKDNVTIDYVLQGEQHGELYLFDATGSILLQKTLPNQTAKTNINVANLPTGIYLLMIKQDGKMVYQTKLIKQ